MRSGQLQHLPLILNDEAGELIRSASGWGHFTQA